MADAEHNKCLYLLRISFLCNYNKLPGNDMMLSSQLTAHSFFSLLLRCKNNFYGAGRALRSTPQPPYIQSSFARQIDCGGFAGYLLLSLAQPHYHAVNSPCSLLFKTLSSQLKVYLRCLCEINQHHLPQHLCFFYGQVLSPFTSPCQQ